jgi:DNA-binding transcriptional LysR family regulator
MLNAHLGKLRLKSLQILLLAEELGSLRAVADAVSTSQPAITQALQELEKIFGQTLLDRDHSGVALTDAGRVVANHARVALGEVSNAAQAVKDKRSVPILRLGTLPFLMFDLVPATLRRLSSGQPLLRLQIHESNVQGLRDRLIAGDDDLVLTRLSASAMDANEFEALRVRKIATETVTLFVGKRHPLYAKASQGITIDPSHLLNCEWILPPPDSQVCQHVNELMVSLGMAPPTPIVQAASLHSMLMMVGATHAVSAAPLSAVLQMGGLLHLTPLKLSKVKTQATNTVAVYHRRQDANPALQLFMNALEKESAIDGIHHPNIG